MITKLKVFFAGMLAMLILTSAPTVPLDHWSWPSLFRGTLLEATYLPTIQSVQAVTVPSSGVWSAHTATATLTTTLKNATNALLVMTGSLSSDSSSGAVGCGAFIYATITNTTTVTGTIGGSGGTCTGASVAQWYGYLIEFPAVFVRSGGSGAINLPNASAPASNTAAISVANTSKVILSMPGWGTDHSFAFAGNGGDNVATQITPKVVVTDTTHLTASLASTNVGNGSGNFNAQVAYSYVELAR